MKHKLSIHTINFSPLKGQSRRIKLLYLILLIAVLILLPMALIAWLQGDHILALIDVISAVFLFIVFLYQKKTHNDNPAIYAGMCFCAFFYLYLFIFGGVGNSAFLWYYTFPLFASFLLGSRKGLIISMSMLTVALIYFLITRLSDFHFALYSSDLMIRFFASMLVVIMFSYVAEKNRESSHASLIKANIDFESLAVNLTENNKKLNHEILQRKNTENKLVFEKQKAEEANKAKSEFLANMSHELRTPLNHIIGFTDLVYSGRCGDLSATQVEYLGDVLSSSRHLLSLINDILDLSKVEAGKMELELTDIHLLSLFNRSLKMVREKALKHQIQFSMKIEDNLDTILADERKLKQVLYNLLSNATKFTPDGGNITLTAERCDDAGQHAGVTEPDKSIALTSNWLKISICDSGIGIKRDDLERIFKSFEQADGSSSRHYQGTGLGLSLTRRLIELHGGRIWAESPGPDHGSTFSFILPCFS